MQKQLIQSPRQVEIADVAARLFTEHGLAGTSMEDIANAIGIKKPTLYHYVQSKAQIVSWIHDACVEAVNPGLRSYIEQDLAPAEILFLVARDTLALLVNKPGYLRVYFENPRDLDAADQAHIVEMRDEYFDMVKSVLARGVDAGEFVVDDLDISALAYFGMCNWSYQWYRIQGPVGPEQMALMLWRIFMNGVKAPGASLVPVYPISYAGPRT